jgi:chemotaxis protein methyltransferase CheR
MKCNFGINLDKKRTLIEGRLTNYLVDRGFTNFSQYFDALFRDRTELEVTKLLSFLTTNYSYFLREWEHFEFLKEKVLPDLKQKASDHDLRIWSAGCSSGEEPYTIAMLLLDFFGTEHGAWNTKVLATDISQKALDLARKGIYADEQMEKVPPQWRAKYFRELGDGRWEIRQNVHDEIIFRAFNLMEETFPFQKKFHVIFCRNVMIYFDKKAKAQLVQKFYDAAEPGGYLFVGHSESIGREETDWRYVMPSIFRKG